SLKEGLGLGLMEAMAAGIAVVGSDVGGIKSLIRGGETGLLVEPGDAAGLARAVSELLNDGQKRKFLGDNAREFIRRNFNLEAMVEETEKFYLRCLSEKD
ncbi:MAG: glycosyltransferase family 4 protein, partial [Candidatus Omnitrophota bacterium]|nr:glycosyltransferase family 4 protein [Candidatus Omnitrophota bacterium]